jgi:hypothetical protein
LCKAAIGIVKIAFATSAGYQGNLGGIDGANAKCQAVATAAGLPGSYLAWLSSSSRNPAAGLAKGGPWYDVNQTLIAPNWSKLQTGTLTNLLQLSADGSGGNAIVWTNTNPDGTATDAANTCSDWTDATLGNSGNLAYANGTGPTWTTAYAGGCEQSHGLYCFQQ